MSGGGVTVTPFLYHLVQGTLQYTHVNHILLYARTSLIRFCSEYVSLLCDLFELALIDSLVFDQVEEDRYRYFVAVWSYWYWGHLEENFRKTFQRPMSAGSEKPNNMGGGGVIG